MGHTADLELSPEEIRVLGCLIEKQRTTPEQYPLTTNALRTACNQKSNREPVVSYDDGVVERAMLSLRDVGFARSVTGTGRTVKHKQVVDEALSLSDAEVSLLGVLMLRGAQTPNELRTRTERLHGFDDNEAVVETLADLEAREVPLVTCIGKAPGQREARWIHLLTDETGRPPPGAATTAQPPPAAIPTDEWAPAAIPTGQPAPPAPAPTGPETTRADGPDRLAELEREVEALREELGRLRARFDDLAAQLGVE